MSETIDDGPLILPQPERRGMLLEHEIKACWRENMLAAADDARQLAAMTELSTATEGMHYMRLKAHLGLAEGACRQMAHWREDARWLYLAPQMETLRQMALTFLQYRQAKVLFQTLEKTLRGLVETADALENKRTGRMGMILPVPGRDVRTEGRLVQVQNPVERAHGVVKGVLQ